MRWRRLVADEAQTVKNPATAVSRAIIVYNRDNEGPRADGIVVTPSHNPPTDGGFKYNPPNGGPAGSEATGWIQDRANEIIAGGCKDVRRLSIASPAEQREIDRIQQSSGAAGFAPAWLRHRGLDWAADLLTTYPSSRKECLP